MREEIIRIAKENGADIVGFAPVSRFDCDDAIFKIFPETRTVIGLAFRVLRGIYRGIEEGSTYYQINQGVWQKTNYELFCGMMDGYPFEFGRSWYTQELTLLQ